jgi:hypothetical protein
VDVLLVLVIAAAFFAITRWWGLLILAIAGYASGGEGIGVAMLFTIVFYPLIKYFRHKWQARNSQTSPENSIPAPKTMPRSTSPSPPTKQVVIDVNTATHNQLITLPGIGAAEAVLILKRTQSGNGFASLEELADYLQLKPHKISPLHGKVRFSARATTSTPRSNHASKPQSPSSQDDLGRIID